MPVAGTFGRVAANLRPPGNRISVPVLNGMVRG